MALPLLNFDRKTGNGLTFSRDLVSYTSKRLCPEGKRRGISMYSKEIIVHCESGLYNKQATYFVQKANDFSCNIWLESENRKMNAKSLLGIMSLSVVTGSVVTISADGTDEVEAVNALEAMLQQDIA